MNERYRCGVCRKWFARPGGVTVSCCVVHPAGACCHAFEVEVTRKGWAKKVSA